MSPENEKYTPNDSDQTTQDSPGVIVKQPTRRIRILNVTYRKNVYKKNTVSHRNVSSAVNGHVRNARNSFNSTYIEAISDGK